MVMSRSGRARIEQSVPLLDPWIRQRMRLALSRGDWRAIGLRVALVAAVGVFVWPAFAHAVEVWSTDEEFTYGYLIAPIALAILWWRRNALRDSIGKGHAAG